MPQLGRVSCGFEIDTERQQDHVSERSDTKCGLWMNLHSWQGDENGYSAYQVHRVELCLFDNEESILSAGLSVIIQ